MIDRDGFRLNVGIIVFNDAGRLLWCRRVNNRNAWQFPQGGIHPGENAKIAMYRELEEELGLLPEDVEYITHTPKWQYYTLPKRFQRPHIKPLCIGQKQKWFLLRLLSDDSRVRLDCAERPEFNHWQWVDYWQPIDQIIEFKKQVYRNVLEAFRAAVQERSQHENT